jgi:uncharacterized protein (TIGR03435 family)
MKRIVLGVISLVLFSGSVLFAQDITGTWQGTLHTAQKDLRTVVKIAKTDAGGLKLDLYSIDQSGQGITATTVSFQDKVLKCAIATIDGSYEGKISADGKSISGTWKQGSNTIPLVLERATPETEWTIPEPPAKLPPMAADADPSFEVATIKPSKPEQQGRGFRMQGRNFSTMNTTLVDLITFTYGVQEKQVIGGADWMRTVKFDLSAQPDVSGAPNPDQLKSMVKKLLADRFQLKFHKDKKELSAYLLSMAKGGPKLTKNDSNPDGLPSLFFRGLGVLPARNTTMPEFTQLLQSAVFDRPVVDQTNLAGRWDFLLKWTPDESQFISLGVKVPPPSEAADAPPPIFTAIQEQIGLKLDAGKAQVDVIVIDHVEKPSEN